MQELKNVKNTVEKEQEKDSNSQKDNLFKPFYRWKTQYIFKKPANFSGFLVYILQSSNPDFYKN